MNVKENQNERGKYISLLSLLPLSISNDKKNSFYFFGLNLS